MTEIASPADIAVLNGPVMNSSIASTRSPPCPRNAMRAPSASMVATQSAAGSAWARLPPIVPRLRTAR
jgi:hypothetical protein